MAITSMKCNEVTVYKLADIKQTFPPQSSGTRQDHQGQRNKSDSSHLQPVLYTLHAESRAVLSLSQMWVMQGGVIWMLQTIATFLGMGHSLKRLAYAQTLEEQQAVWNSNWFVHFCKQGNAWLVDIFVRILAVIFLNRFVLW